MKITEAMVRESVEKNMNSFRKKALGGGVDGEDVADLFGYGELYDRGVSENSEFEEIRSLVEKEMGGEELGVEKDLVGRDVLAEAEGDEEQTEGAESGTEGEDAGSETDKKEEEGESSDKGEEKSASEEENADVDKAKEKNDEVKGDKELKPGETTTIQNFDEFFKRTDTKLSVKLEGKEPSPVFGPNDTREHNKYTVTITNNKGGSISWTYWDSIANTEKNVVPDDTDIMRDFGENLELAVVGKSFQEFKRACGYDNTEDGIAQQQYNNLRKMKDSIKKIYPDQHQVYELIQVAKKV